MKIKKYNPQSEAVLSKVFSNKRKEKSVCCHDKRLCVITIGVSVMINKNRLLYSNLFL